MSLTTEPSVEHPSMRVVLVEDSPADAEIVADLLEAGTASGDIELIHEGRITATLERLGRSGVDCVLLDLSLPDSRGLDGVRAIRAADPDVAIVVLTGLSDSTVGDAALALGAQDFLSKDDLHARHLRRSITFAVERQRQQVIARLDAIEVLKAKARFQRAFDSAPMGMALVGTDRRFGQVNTAFTQMLDYRASHMVNLRVSDVVHADDLDAFDAAFERLLDESSPTFRMECRLSGLHERAVWVLVAAAKVDEIGEGGAYVLVQAQDISALKELEEALVDQNLHDPLTGLSSVAALHDRLERALESLGRVPGTIAVIHLDLDSFQSVVEGHGRGRADELLVEVGRRLRGVCQPGDTVARLRGDAFVVLAERISDPTEISEMADRMRAAAAASAAVLGLNVALTASVGVAVTSDPRRHPSVVLREAAMAVRRAKEQGKDRVEMFERGAEGRPDRG